MATQKTIKPTTKECIGCKDQKKLTDFYNANNPLTSTDGKKVNLCKKCYREMSLDADGITINKEGLKFACQLMDFPYIEEVLNTAIDSASIGNRANGTKRADTLSEYARMCNSLPQYKGLGFINSMRLNSDSDDRVSAPYQARIVQSNKDDLHFNNSQDDFIVTDDMMELFGEGYDTATYKKMHKKYEKLRKNYDIQTSMHEEALATYVSRKVREEIATAKGDVQAADKWGKLAAQSAIDGKLTPKQLSEADMQGGLSTFSEIFTMVENAKERIKIFPEFKYDPKDSADFIIWCYINYERNLNNLPEVEYKDIYAFYDRKREEYINQYGDPYGIFKNDPSEGNRDVVEAFITIPPEFRD